MKYLLRTNASYVTSRTEIRATIFNACWARWFGNGSLSTKFFVCLRLLASDNGLYELANILCNVGPVVYKGCNFSLQT